MTQRFRRHSRGSVSALVVDVLMDAGVVAAGGLGALRAGAVCGAVIEVAGAAVFDAAGGGAALAVAEGCPRAEHTAVEAATASAAALLPRRQWLTRARLMRTLTLMRSGILAHGVQRRNHALAARVLSL